MSKKIKVKVFNDENELSIHLGNRIQQLILEKQSKKKNVVLCLPTGSSPLLLYQELIRLHQEEELSFYNVITFNLGEYFQMKSENLNSFNYYMNEKLFKHIDIKRENINIVKGDMDVEMYDKWCKNYEEKIEKLGGIDMTVLGIGKTGHIAFNEPGSNRNDLTRLIVLHNQTRKDNSRFFKNRIDDVPKYAVTMGIGTIYNKSKEIVLIATGFHKSKIIKDTLENGKIDKSTCPSAFLRGHRNCHFYCDKNAARLLKHVQSPWEITQGSSSVSMIWNESNIKKAVIWLSLRTGKSILKLNEDDFNDNYLSSLYYKCNGDVETICSDVYYDLMTKIHNNKHNVLLPFGKEDRVIIFAPHPDDEVISLGGTLKILTDHKDAKNIKIAYMTSGSRAISKNDIKRHARFTFLSLPVLNIDKSNKGVKKRIEVVENEIEKSVDYQEDSKLIQVLKTNIRKCEAINSIESIGLSDKNASFLNLPFYQTGKDNKLPRSQKDVDAVLKLFNEFQPTHFVICFDLEDPHGTHAECYYITKQAIEIYKKKLVDKKKKLHYYLYKGAWQEFDTYMIDIFIPLSQSIMDCKIDSIFQHGSQKDKPMFPGDDKREFYQRAKDRNFLTAKVLSQLGLASHYAIEGLKKVDNLPSNAY